MTTTYHNEPARKAAMSAAMEDHRRLDRIVQGATGGGRVGCTVACAYQSVQKSWDLCYDHRKLADHLGVPSWVPCLADRIFERLPKEGAAQFAVDWLAAIPVGADPSKARARIGAFVVKTALDAAERAMNIVEKHRDAITAKRIDAIYRERDTKLRAVLALIRTESGTMSCARSSELRSSELRSDIWKIRRVAAEAAVATAVAEAAEVAEVAAVAAVVEAAEVAEAAVTVAAVAAGIKWNCSRYYSARDAARRAFWRAQADEFLATLREMPVAA